MCMPLSRSDGTWLVVEPFAHDRLVDNLNPVGRIYYAASTMICTPASLSQEVGSALGAQAGELRLREVITGGGFTRFPARNGDAVQSGAGGSSVGTRQGWTATEGHTKMDNTHCAGIAPGDRDPRRPTLAGFYTDDAVLRIVDQDESAEPAERDQGPRCHRRVL